MSKARRSPRTPKDRAIEEIYREIPAMKSCSGKCAAACGPIAMFTEEWKRIIRAKGGRVPKLRPGSLVCPMLSPNGWCTVYPVRPYICRLWGTTKALRCPEGCEPERWLSKQEARGIFLRLHEIAGPGTDGPMSGVDDLWMGIALDAREDRAELLEKIRKVVMDERET